MKQTALEPLGSGTSGGSGSEPLSVVLPVFNEVENIEALSASLISVLSRIDCEWEIIFVDDGSTDGSDRAIKAVCDSELRCRLIQLRRNFGQTAALSAGLSASRGAIVVTLDADRQNDPEDIPLLLEKLHTGFDLVNGWRKERHDPLVSRRLPSMAANWLISLITGLRLHDFGCSLKVIRKEIVDELALYGEMHRFIPAIASQIGARVAELPVRHHPRVAGKSKYGISRTLRVVLDLITIKFLSDFSTRPSHLFGFLGLLAVLGGSAVTGFLVLEKIFFKAELADRPLLLLAIFVTLVGIQFISMGLIGEMLSRVYHESQRKPIYVVKEVYSGRAEKGAILKPEGEPAGRP